MQNVLVTGGAGFIGANFIHYLLMAESQVRIINLDALTYAGHLENLVDVSDPSRYSFVHGNICDRDLLNRLFHNHKIDTVIHFAAETHVDRSILKPDQFIQTNIVGTFNLLEAARQAWLVENILPQSTYHFHHVSTDEVYGTLKPEDPPFVETSPYTPRSPYAASKAASNHLVEAYFTTYGLPTTITNCSNNYGPFQHPEKLIPLAIINALKGSPIPVYGDGNQIRDWLFVRDHCEAIHKVILKGRLGEAYNVGGNNQPTNIEVVQRLCTLLDELAPDSKNKPHISLLKFVPDRPGHDRRYEVNFNKIKEELGWQPSQSFESDLEQTVNWYLSHPKWVSEVCSSSENISFSSPDKGAKA